MQLIQKLYQWLYYDIFCFKDRPITLGNTKFIQAVDKSRFIENVQQVDHYYQLREHQSNKKLTRHIFKFIGTPKDRNGYQSYENPKIWQLHHRNYFKNNIYTYNYDPKI